MERLTDEQRDRAAAVWWIAEAAVNRFCRDQPGMRRYRSELTSFAGLYLLRVVASYNPERGASLETYTTQRMRYLSAEWLRHEFGRPDESPLRYTHSRSSVSLFTVVGWDFLGEPILLADTLSDEREPAPECGGVAAENRERVERLLRKLNERERRIVELVSLHGMQQSDAAKRLGLAKSRVSQLFTVAVRRLGGHATASEEGDE